MSDARGEHELERNEWKACMCIASDECSCREPGNGEMWKWEILYGANTSNCHELLMPVQSGCSMNAP